MNENIRFVIVNLIFQAPLGRVKRNGNVTGKPKYYKTVPQVIRAYQLLNPLGRSVSRPAAVYPDGSYRLIEFTMED